MYTRVPTPKGKPAVPPQIKQEPIQIPKNYSGNAFSSDGTQMPLTPPANDTRQYEPERVQRPHFSPSPNPTFPSHIQGPLGYSDYPEHAEAEAYEHDVNEAINKDDAYANRTDEKPSKPHDTLPVKAASSAGSLFSAMLGDGLFKNNFPFGHGLGSEELLILGIMLSIYLSGAADGELMLLLGILLFAG